MCACWYESLNIINNTLITFYALIFRVKVKISPTHSYSKFRTWFIYWNMYLQSTNTIYPFQSVTLQFCNVHKYNNMNYGFNQTWQIITHNLVGHCSSSRTLSINKFVLSICNSHLCMYYKIVKRIYNCMRQKQNT